MALVLPGCSVPLDGQTKTKVGRGLLQDKDAVVSSKVGILRQRTRGKKKRRELWVENNQKRYAPTLDDMVIATVLDKHAENYKVDIGASQVARLPVLAFEGASKRNRPHIAVGALVYCRVAMMNKDMETEVTCTSPYVKKEWVTGESLFGPLTGGYCFSVSLKLAQKLLDEDSWTLKCIARYVPFECAIGLNGKVWVNAGSPMLVVLISNAILNADGMSDSMVTTMVDKIMRRA